MADFTRINQNKGQVLTHSQLHHICRKAFEIIDIRGEGGLTKEEIKEWIQFAREHIYMHTPALKDDGSPLLAFDEEAFNQLYDKLPKKIFEAKGEWPTETRVQLKPLWEIVEKEAEEDGVLFQPFRQLEIA